MDSVLDDLAAGARELAAALLGQFWRVLRYPLQSDQRIFVLYLLTSLLFALWIFVRSPHGAGGDPTTPQSTRLRRFLFPRHVWSSPSAWLDVRYFFMHQMLRLALTGPLAVVVGALSYLGLTRLLTGQAAPDAVPAGGGLVVALAVALAVTALGDLVAYTIHRLQHTVSWLWEFHKVHHSATVMHPLSNYREHPVDNIAYTMGAGLVVGSMTAVVVAVLGYEPSSPAVLGAGVFTFVFNVLAYNLRHSHLWLRWTPGWLNVVIGSPAHHHVHHSYYPEHINKNFAFLFPVWDKLFGTWCLPATNENVRFGLNGRDEHVYESCLDLYFLPLRNLVRRARPQRAIAELEGTVTASS